MPPSGERECGAGRWAPSSLPFGGRGCGVARGGSRTRLLFGHLLPPAGPGRAGRGAAARPGRCCGRPVRTRGSFISLFSRRCRLPLGQAGGRPALGRREAGCGRPGAERSPLPLFGTSQTLLPASAGEGESWGRGGVRGGALGRAKVRNQQKADKQTKTVEWQRLSRFITALS